MARVRESVDVAVPVHIAYERLCHFADHPRFRSGVRQVTLLSDDLAHWVMDLAGTPTEFDARITQQRPDELLAWEAIDEPRLAETMMFQRLSDSRTRIIAEVRFELPALTRDGDFSLEALDRRLRGDMEGFKRFIEDEVAGGPARAGDDSLAAHLEDF